MSKLNKDSQFGFMVDQSRCVGCRTCQIACKDYQDSPIGVNFRRVYEYEGGGYSISEEGTIISNDVFAYYTSIRIEERKDNKEDKTSEENKG